LLADPAAVNVRVEQGVVRIVGQLDTPDLVEVLLEQVRNVEGVVDVEASLTSTVDPSAEAERAQEFGGSTALPAD
jgi:osmotically-inducible protein OsmY